MKPSPIVTGTICSACGLDWDRHDKKTLDTCVELLKADLAREKQRLTPQPAIPYPVVPYPYPTPRPYPGVNPYPWFSRPHWISQSTSGGVQASRGPQVWNFNSSSSANYLQ